MNLLLLLQIRKMFKLKPITCVKYKMHCALMESLIVSDLLGCEYYCEKPAKLFTGERERELSFYRRELSRGACLNVPSKMVKYEKQEIERALEEKNYLFYLHQNRDLSLLGRHFAYEFSKGIGTQKREKIASFIWVTQLRKAAEWGQFYKVIHLLHQRDQPLLDKDGRVL